MLKAPRADWGMQLRQPATRWQDALPCGNGTLGAMVYGNVHHERVLINHEALWFRTAKPDLPDVSAHLPALRQLLAAGRYREARQILPERVAEANPALARSWVDPYHPAFDLELVHGPHPPFTHYRRRLDFTTGMARVDWAADGVRYDRELFVSRADDLIVMRVRASRRGCLNLSMRLCAHEVANWDDNWFEGWLSASSIPLAFESGAAAGELWLTARYTEGTPALAGGMYGGLAAVQVKGGQVAVEGSVLRVAGADALVVRLGVFTGESAATGMPALRSRLAAAPKVYTVLARRHVRLHRPLFTRMQVTLGPASDTPNEDLLAAAYDNRVEPQLLSRLAAFGRYLLISSSRPGGWPANLQGVWNGNYFPAWASDYHNDENIQMCYWQALGGNLAEVCVPYVDYVKRHLGDWQENARRVYGCRGVLAPIAQSTDGRLHPGVWMNWTAGAGWLAQLFYEYWLFTGDRAFLRDHVVPLLTEVASFYEDFLVDGPDGRLLFAPSLSPENSPDIPDRSSVVVNATMDVAVAREVLGGLCAACETLRVLPERVARWRGMLARMPPYAVNADGALKEWLHPDLADQYRHRHMSHLYPLFPGSEVNQEDTPELFAAARRAVELRLVVGLHAQAGWSFPQMACIYARLGEGDRALACLELLARSCVGPNLFTYHNDWRGQGLSLFWGFKGLPPFQIDANMGLTAAVQEMLLQSRPGFVALLPARPAAWRAGAMSGMRIRGGGTVSLRWDRRGMAAELIPDGSGVLVLRTPGPLRRITGAGVTVRRRWSAHGYRYTEVSVTGKRPLRLQAGWSRVR